MVDVGDGSGAGANSAGSGVSFRVTHAFKTSTASDNLFVAEVTIENTGSQAAEDVRYRRVVDWDAEPTPSEELVTIGGEKSPYLLFSSNEGFASPDPLDGKENYGASGFFKDHGPDDQGTLVDLSLGAIEPGAKRSFKLYYGAAADQPEAVAALESVSADKEVYSLAKPYTGAAEEGAPNTFVMAFSGLDQPPQGPPGGPPSATDDAATTDENSPIEVNVLENDTDPDGDALTVSDYTQPQNGRADCTPEGLCTYTPEEDFSGEDSFTYKVSDSQGGTDTARVTVAVEKLAPPPDTAPPDTAISSGPEGLTNSDRASFAFSSTEPGSTFLCKLDDGPAEECASPKTYTDLVDGEHTFKVAATDEAGNEDSEPAVRRWTVDTTAPAIDGRSPEKDVRGVASTKSVTVTFSEALDPQTVKGATFFLTRQGATAAVPATVSYEAATETATLDPSSNLASDASYTVTVKGGSAAGGGVKDKAGNALAGDETWSFTTVDATPPETSIESGPSGLTNKKSASFAFSSTEPGGSFSCSLDGGAYSACTSPATLSDLQDGSHTFRVRATDQAGNTDATPAVRRWSVDTTSPKVDSITPAGGARGVARTKDVEVTFSEPMDASTVNRTTVTLVKGTSGTPLSATVTYDAANKQATLDPSANLDYGETYTARVKGGSGDGAGGAKDRAGNTLSADREWSFTVEPDPVGAKPAISKGTTGETGFYLRYTLTGGNADEISTASFDASQNVTVMGDWDGNGTKTPGIYRGGGRFSLWNTLELGRAPDQSFRLLKPGTSTDAFSRTDPPLVGDWNGDGKDTIGVREGATFYLKNQNTEGEPDLTFAFGRSNDKPVVGDWNGDGKDSVGIRREAQWILKNTNAGGEGDLSFGYGVASDTPVVGDWDGDGDDTVGIVRDGRWIVRNANSSGYGDLIFNYGPAGARPLVW